jgi:hypothetical protein
LGIAPVIVRARNLLICASFWFIQRIEHGLAGTDGILVQPDVSPRRISDDHAVLGKSILEEIWKDQDRLVLPSFVYPLPFHFGSQKRTPTADQWRSIGTIHLVTTLIRLWGRDDGRKRAMLNNYMHLITAIHIASSRISSELHVNDYTYHYQKYLDGMVSLYKEAKVSQTAHLCAHIGPLLRAFGPVHSWRTWAFERFNYTLQNINTNGHFGTYQLRLL